MSNGPGRIQAATGDVGTVGFRRGGKLRFTDAGSTATQDAVDPTRVDVTFDLSVGSAYAELGAPLDTVAAALEDMAGFAVTLVLARAGRIHAVMTYTCESTLAGVNATAGHAIEINGVDGQEAQRVLTGANDMGVGAVQARSAVLPAGDYVVQGRHRRVAGTRTVTTTLAQLHATGPLAG